MTKNEQPQKNEEREKEKANLQNELREAKELMQKLLNKTKAKNITPVEKNNSKATPVEEGVVIETKENTENSQTEEKTTINESVNKNFENYEKAKEIVLNSKDTSFSNLARKLKISINKAKKLLDELEKEGIVGPSNGVSPRKFLGDKEIISSTTRRGGEKDTEIIPEKIEVERDNEKKSNENKEDEKLTTSEIGVTLNGEEENSENKISIAAELDNVYPDLEENNMIENNIPQNENNNVNNKSGLENTNFEGFLESENKGFFNKMSEGGKNIMRSAYEGIYKTPGLNRVVGKLEIAYSQFWIDKKEEKSVKLKDKIDAFSLKDEALNTSKEEMESLIKDLESQGIPGSASLSLKIKEIQGQKNKLANKKDKLQSKIELKENEINLYTNKRDGVADRLISHYDKKLSPIEGKLDVLQSKRDSLDLVVTVVEIKHDEQIARLNEIKDKKIKIEEAFRKSGESERKIKNSESIKVLNKLIEDGYKKIEQENLKLSYKKDDFDKKVAKVDKKAQPYRDRKDEFIRIKNNRPIKIDLEKRETAKEFTNKENTSANTRMENSEDYSNESTTENTSANSRIDNSKESEGKIELLDIINHFNEVIKKIPDIKHLSINIKDLILETRSLLSSNTKLSPVQFIKIIEKYYKVKKVPDYFVKKIISNLK